MPHSHSVPFMTPLSDQWKDHRQLCEWQNKPALTLHTDLGIVASLGRMPRLHLLKRVKDFRNNLSYDCFAKRKISIKVCD